jgi:hypothetical protein
VGLSAIRLCLLHLVQDGAGELVRGGLAAHIACSEFAIVGLVEHLVN